MIKVGVVVSARITDAGDFLANVRALESAGAEMIGVDGDLAECWVALAAVAAVTERVRLRLTLSEPEGLHALSRGRGIAAEDWIHVEVPADRASWNEMLRKHEAAGAPGVVVPWDPRLIDLLRNPDADDRSDLLMSTG